MRSKIPDGYLTTAQLMRRWQCNRRLIDYWCEVGRLAFIKVGRYRYYRLFEVKKFEKGRNGII